MDEGRCGLDLRCYVIFDIGLLPWETTMLDSYIIDRIRRQNPPLEQAQVPLYIEVPQPRPPVEPEVRPLPPEREERGITTIDFSI